MPQPQPQKSPDRPKISLKGRVMQFIRSWGPVIVIVVLLRSFVVESFRIPSGSMEDTLLNGDMLLVNWFIYGIKIPFTTKDIIKVRQPTVGDIIVFRHPAEPDWPLPEENYFRFFPKWFPLFPLYWDKTRHWFKWYAPANLIKRCVALAGDTVEMRSKMLYVNGKARYEPFVVHQDPQVFEALHVSPRDYQTMWEQRSFYDNWEVGGRVRDNFGPVVVPTECVMAMGDNRDNSADSRFWGPLDKKYIKGKALIIYFYLGSGGIKWDRIGRLIR
jgi:signal peptidase I